MNQIELGFGLVLRGVNQPELAVCELPRLRLAACDFELLLVTSVPITRP